MNETELPNMHACIEGFFFCRGILIEYSSHHGWFKLCVALFAGDIYDCRRIFRLSVAAHIDLISKCVIDFRLDTWKWPTKYEMRSRHSQKCWVFFKSDSWSMVVVVCEMTVNLNKVTDNKNKTSYFHIVKKTCGTFDLFISTAFHNSWAATVWISRFSSYFFSVSFFLYCWFADKPTDLYGWSFSDANRCSICHFSFIEFSFNAPSILMWMEKNAFHINCAIIFAKIRNRLFCLDRQNFLYKFVGWSAESAVCCLQCIV